MRHIAEIHDDLRHALGQALAGAHVEGHPLPAPVVDMGLQCHERFGVAVVAQFLVITGHDLAPAGTAAILAGNAFLSR